MENTHDKQLPLFIDDELELNENFEDLEDDVHVTDDEHVPFSYEDDTIPASEKGFMLWW